MCGYVLKAATSRHRQANQFVEGSLHAQVFRTRVHTAVARGQRQQALCTGRWNLSSTEHRKHWQQQQQPMYDRPKRGANTQWALRAPRVLAKASYVNDPNGSSNGPARGRSGGIGIPPPPLLPPPYRHGVLRGAPPALLKPLINAVITVSGGRLALLPAAAVAWLLRTLLSVGHTPPPAWIAEAYDILTNGVDELQPGQAATAFLAIASLAVSSSRTAELVVAATGSTAQAPPRLPPLPPPALLPGLYAAMARPGRTGSICPRVALACLEEAAAAGELDTGVHLPHESGGTAAVRQDLLQPQYCSNASADTPPRVMGNESIGSKDIRVRSATNSVGVVGSDGNSRWAAGALDPLAVAEAGQTLLTGGGVEHPTSTDPWVIEAPSQEQWRRSWNLSPAMPRPLVELLVRRAVRLPPFEGKTVGPAAAAAAAAESKVFGPAAAVVAARAVIAAAHLTHPPPPAMISYIATVIVENCGSGGPFGTTAGGDGGGGGGGSPQMLVHALSALCTLSSEPLPPPTVEALVRGLDDQLTELDAVQISHCIAAVQRLAAEAVPAAAERFARGPAASELTRQLPELSAAELAAALAALPPPLQPPPAPLAAAAHEALRRGLAAADSDDLAEVLRQLSTADALPLYGWQGELAAALSRRFQDVAAAALISSQEICNTMFVLAALNYRPGFNWTAAAAAALQPRLLTLTPPQLTNALWALAKFGYRPESPWSTFAVQALQLQLPSLRPHQLSYGLGSLQRMGCHVNAAVLDEMLAAAAAQLAQYPPSELVLLLMTVARLRHVPSYSFTEAVTERLRPHLAAPAVAAPTSAAVVPLDLRGPAVTAPPLPLTCQELASVGYALAKLHSRPEPEWMSAYMDACLTAMGAFSPDLLGSLLWAVGELGQVPSPAWISAFLAAARPRLSEFAPQDLVSVLSSFAALRTPPPAEWLGEALTVLGARVGGLDGMGVTALLKALVDLDARVGNPEWYEALCDQVSPFLPLLPAGTLVDLVSSLGTLGHKPQVEWLQRCSVAVVRAQAQAMKPVAVKATPTGVIDVSGGFGGGFGGGISRGGGNGGGGGLSVQQLEALVCGMARMGAMPPVPLLQAFFAATATSLAVMTPDRVTAVASALAGAKVAPEPTWLDSLAIAVRNDVMSYTLVQLDALTRALAVFQGLVPEHGATKDLLAFLREFCLYG